MFSKVMVFNHQDKFVVPDVLAVVPGQFILSFQVLHTVNNYTSVPLCAQCDGQLFLYILYDKC